jgi:hypothetical protein
MTWIQTASGRRFDLANPRAADIDFDTDVPDALARIARFTGHINAGPYSVAQHSVHCCDVVYGETGDPVAAAYALLHDAHEAYIGDWSTPLKQAIRQVAEEGTSFDVAGILCEALDRFEARVEDAIHAAAGLPWSLSPRNKMIVKDVDRRLLHAERKQLLDGAGHPRHRWFYDDKPPKAVGLVLRIMPWPQAADQFRERFRRIVPEALALIAKRGSA